MIPSGKRGIISARNGWWMELARENGRNPARSGSGDGPVAGEKGE